MITEGERFGTHDTIGVGTTERSAFHGVPCAARLVFEVDRALARPGLLLPPSQMVQLFCTANAEDAVM